MARRRNKNQDWDYQFKRPQLNLKKETSRAVIVVVFVVISILFILSLAGLAGTFGSILSKVIKLAFGWMAYGAPVIFLLVAIALLRQKDEEHGNTVSTHAYVGAVLMTLTITGLMHLWVIRNDLNAAFDLVKEGSGGGYLGLLTSYPLMQIMGFIASSVVLLAGTVVSVLVTFNISIKDLLMSKQTESVKPKPANNFKINNAQGLGFTKEPVGELNKSLKDSPPLVNLPEDIRIGAKKIPITAAADKNWKFPPLDLLDETPTKVDSGNIEANVSIIQKTLNDFGIEVEMGEVNVGPTVTQYTLRPAIGVKLAQIAGLQNDLALALAASSIRMELPIPGKALVGVEIPNKTTAIVRIKELIGSSVFNEHHSKLAFSLGRDVAGHPLVADLASMPHLLIAGATGSGKSIAINSVLLSFLYRATPSEVKFILVDPKRVELSLYNGLPHLLAPVIIDHQKAVNALRWAVAEMDRRYRLLSEVHKRNIGEYNQASLIRLPYIVVVVDELADLMSVAQNEVEAAIVRLAQMARAVGVHLVVATQRPSVDVITGLIKANITSRMAFAVASQVDSRTILDMAGAEKLLGRGDMLYITSELPKPKRIQGTFVTEKEIKKITDFIRKQSGDVIYDEQILERPSREINIPGFSSGSDDDDELLSQATKLVQSSGKASSSMLQRRLRIGYARAARLLDILEEKGIVGPADGAKARDVFGVNSSESSEEESTDREY